MCQHFLSTSISFLPSEGHPSKTLGAEVYKIDMPFVDEISGLAMTKLFDLETGCTLY